MMTYRRTWFSYVLWFLFTAQCVALLATDGVICIRYSAGLTGVMLLIAGFSVVPLAVCLYWVIRSVSVGIRKKYVWKEHAARIMVCILFLLIMAGGLFVRIVRLNEYVWSGEPLDVISPESMRYFEQAKSAMEGLVSPMDYGIEYLYVMLLSVVLSFLGNKIVSAMFLQIVLQLIGMVCVYAVTLKLAGRIPACVSYLYMAGSICCLNMLEFFGPEWLFFVLYMICMLIAVSFVKRYCENTVKKPLAVVCAVIIGALIGGLTYLDMTGASLLAVMLIAALGKKTGLREEVRRNYSKGMNAMVIICAYLSWAAVWHGAAYAAAYARGTWFLADITDRMRMCYRNIYPGFYPIGQMVGQVFPYNSDIYLVMLLLIPASFLIFEFFRNGKEQNYVPWIILCMVVAPTPLTTYGEHGFGVLSLYIWAALAGLGLQNCLFGGKTKVMQAAIEEINSTAEKAEETKSMENNEVKSNYIENPLPLPKKHVPREMDYQYAVEEKDMKYDVEISENDDFDVQ